MQYDPEQVSHSDVLELFFRIHDPTTPDRQGADVGSQYRSALWLSNAAQSSAFAKLRVLHEARFPDPIVTEVHELADATFFAAEEYHQRYVHVAMYPWFCVHRWLVNYDRAAEMPGCVLCS